MSDNTFSEWRKSRNIRPLTLPNKEKFYTDLMNIEYSWSGRTDIWSIGNTFIFESQQELVNAMELFELGYFDCAYYALRTAVDISTTIVFLADMPSDQQEEYLASWKETKDFPMQHRMIKLLSQQGNVFVDMKEKMPYFFIDAKELSSKLNKYVHKQGLQHFYVSRNHPVAANRSQETFISNFETYLKQCIGVVAVMRLAIDPFPVLLMDENILFRCFDSMTEPYSEDFVNEYIGQEYLDAYKTTDLFMQTYDMFANKPLKKRATFDVVKHQCVDSRLKEDILSQLSLMSEADVVCSLLVFSDEKITKIYYNGFDIYFSERSSKRTSWSWSSVDFKRFENSEQKINLQYDEAFISIFCLNSNTYFVEHNEEFTLSEYQAICEYVQREYQKVTN